MTTPDGMLRFSLFLTIAPLLGCEESDLILSDTPPIARIDGPRQVRRGDVVELSAARSFSSSGDLQFAWAVDRRPGGSSAAPDNPSSRNIRFEADAKGTYTVGLVVSVDALESERATIEIEAVNNPPVANAGGDRGLVVPGPIQLDGSTSFDPDSDPLTYAWTLEAAPAGSSAEIAGEGSPAPTLVIDVLGSYHVRLSVSDGAATADDTAIITFDDNNQPPVADAGPDLTISPGGTAQLDGSASFDPEGDAITYAWTIAASPAGSAAALDDPSAVRPTLTTDLEGTYTIQLVVSDRFVESAPDDVVVQAREPGMLSDTFNPEDIYIFGTLSEGSCGADAIAHIDDANTYVTGFDCYADERSAIIRPSDGRLLYTIVFDDRLYEYRCDECPGAGNYPQDPTANDVLVPTDPCIPNGQYRLNRFLVGPDGRLIFTCADASTWYTESGDTLYEGTHQLLHLGYGGVALARDFDFVLVDVDTGAVTPISGVPLDDPVAIRALPDGFWVAIANTTVSQDGVDLYQIDLTGTSSVVGSYASVPRGYVGNLYAGALDAAGRLFQEGSGPTTFQDVILRRTIDGQFDVVFDEATNPVVKLHISAIFTGP